MFDIFILVGIYFLLTVVCIIKKLRHFKSVGFNLLWLILYNEVIVIFSACAIVTPSSEHVPGTTRGYFPGELISGMLFGHLLNLPVSLPFCVISASIMSLLPRFYEFLKR